MAILSIVQDFRAPAARLFEAWLNPVLMQRWRFQRDDNEVVRVTTAMFVRLARVVERPEDAQGIDQ